MSEDLHNKADMEYRHLGPTGIKVSVISYGNWVNSNSTEAKQLTIDAVRKAWDLGINFFDTAEIYGEGEAERQIGEALRQLNVPRHKYVVSTKLFWEKFGGPPNSTGLSRKHVIEGMRNSLQRLGLDYVDVVFCHRPDYSTPLEETCRAFDWIIRRGLAFYWGTSEWNAEDIAEAHAVCERYGLIKPIAEQSEYNLFRREKIEFQFRHLFEAKKLGSTVWSPLAMGFLTGKYNDGIPEGSRFDKNPDLKKFLDNYMGAKNKENTIKALRGFGDIAKELGCTQAQLAMAWVINNPDVSTAITGVTRIEQLEDTVKAVAVRRKITPEIERRIEDLFQTAPKGKLDMPKGAIHKSRRFSLLGYGESKVLEK